MDSPWVNDRRPASGSGSETASTVTSTDLNAGVRDYRSVVVGTSTFVSGEQVEVQGLDGAETCRRLLATAGGIHRNASGIPVEEENLLIKRQKRKGSHCRNLPVTSTPEPAGLRLADEQGIGAEKGRKRLRSAS
jgi:hypothetical protein